MRTALRLGILAVGFAAGLTTMTATTAQAADDFYKGKDVKILIGFPPGGGYDLYARAIARHMGRHIPGNPTVTPQNMPGAGSVLVVNHLANVAPKDGTVIAAFASGIPSVPLLSPEQAKFKSEELTWIGSANTEVQIDILWHQAPAKTLEDIQKTEVILGGTGPGAATVDFPKMVNGILGFKYKLILGYQGTTDIKLAVERGELHGYSGSTWASAKTQARDWLRDKKINVIGQYGAKPHPDIPEVPLVVNMAKSKEDRQALDLIFSRQETGRPYAAPPGIPAERTAILRKAFMDTLMDPQFLAEANKTDLEILPMDGPELAAIIGQMAKTPPSVVARVAKILGN